MKQTPSSLFERAAELYDFGAPLRTPAPPAPRAEPIAAPVPDRPAAPVTSAVPEIELPVARSIPCDDAAVIDRFALAEAGFVVPEGAVTGIAEDFRLIKHQLLAAIGEAPPEGDPRARIVLIASAQPKAGKTFCAVNLALSLAGERDVEVLLVDGDVPNPDALSKLGIDGNGPGLIDALADPGANPESFVIRTDVPGLSVLPAGRKTNNVPELLASDRTREVLAKLVAGDRKRIVLIDSPPALMASHATVLARHVGQALVVVRADQTTEADLRETIGLLSGCGHLSLVLNGAGLAVTGRKFGAYDGYGHD
jgi:protein-tyrosine kinase